MLRTSRGSAKLVLVISLAVNIVILIALFLPSEKVHEILGDEAWSKLSDYRVGWRTEEQHAFALQQGSSCGMCQFDPELCKQLG